MVSCWLGTGAFKEKGKRSPETEVIPKAPFSNHGAAWEKEIAL